MTIQPAQNDDGCSKSIDKSPSPRSKRIARPLAHPQLSPNLDSLPSIFNNGLKNGGMTTTGDPTKAQLATCKDQHSNLITHYGATGAYRPHHFD